MCLACRLIDMIWCQRIFSNMRNPWKKRSFLKNPLDFPGFILFLDLLDSGVGGVLFPLNPFNLTTPNPQQVLHPKPHVPNDQSLGNSRTKGGNLGFFGRRLRPLIWHGMIHFPILNKGIESEKTDPALKGIPTEIGFPFWGWFHHRNYETTQKYRPFEIVASPASKKFMQESHV